MPSFSLRSQRIGTLLLVPVLVHLANISGFADCDLMPRASGFAIGLVSQVLPGACYIDGNATGTTQALGHVVAESWLHLRIPWWNPYAGVGLPLAAEMQPAVFFLPFVLLLHFASGVLLLKMAMQAVAGLCMLACLRSMGIGRTVALCGAVLFELNGTFAWFGDAPMLPVAFLPMLVFGLERSRVLAQSGRRGGSIAIACGLAFSLVAGFPETAFIDGLLALAWCLVVFCGLGAPARLRFAGKVLAGGLGGLCLSAPAVIPFLEGLTHANSSIHGLAALDWLRDGQWAALLIPTVFGPPFGDGALGDWGCAGGYVGVGVTLPAFLAVMQMRNRKPLRLALATWVIVWLAVFLHLPPFFRLWRVIPVLNLAQVTRYAMPSIAFGCIVLACMGLDDWRLGGDRRPVLISGLLLVLCGAAGMTSVAIDRIGSHAGWLALRFALPSAIWATILALALCLALGRRGRRSSLGAAIAMILADATVSFVLPTLAGGKPSVVDTAPVAFLRAEAGFARTYALTGILPPNTGSYFGIPSLVAFDEPMPTEWADHLGRLDPRLDSWKTFMTGLPPQSAVLIDRIAAFEAAGVRFVMVAADRDPFSVYGGGGGKLRQVLRSPTAHIYELPHPAPYFSITGGPCRMDVLDRTMLQTRCDGPARLTRLELAYPGWHAHADAGKLHITATPDGFQQVTLPAGIRRVRFDYKPPYWPWIQALFGVGVVAMIVLAWRARRR